MKVCVWVREEVLWIWWDGRGGTGAGRAVDISGIRGCCLLGAANGPDKRLLSLYRSLTSTPTDPAPCILAPGLTSLPRADISHFTLALISLSGSRSHTGTVF